VRPGLLELTAILRTRTSQESTWVFLFGSNPPTLIYFHPRPAPVRHTYMCARSQGNGDLDTSTTSLSLIFNQPLLYSLFTSVSLHTTFLLIKQKNRLPSDRSISAPYTPQSTSTIPHRPRHRRQTFDHSVVRTSRPSHLYNGHDIAATSGFRQQWSPTAPQDEHRFPLWPGQREHRDDRQLLRSCTSTRAYASHSPNLPDALLPTRAPQDAHHPPIIASRWITLLQRFLLCSSIASHR
jgi:hypothetical protein